MNSNEGVSRRTVTALALATMASEATATPFGQTRQADHVALDLQFDFAARCVRGFARLTITPTESAETLALDAVDLVIASVKDANGNGLAHTVSAGEGDGNLRISLGKRVAAGVPIILDIAYESTAVNETDPGNIWASAGLGLRFLGPSASDTRRRVQAWSSNQPGSNRRWFPSIDRPNHLRTFELRATVPGDLMAISNGRLLNSRRNADGTRTFHWRQDRPHQNHRSAVAVSAFADAPVRAGRQALSNFGPPDELDGVNGSTVRLAEMARWLQSTLGSALPMGGYTQAFVQDLPWGMSGAGLALLTENFIDSAEVHRDFLYLWDDLEAESLAEQWFGNSVAPRGWEDHWLARGISRYLAGAFNAHANGETELLLSPYHVAGEVQTVLGDWAGGDRTPVVPQKVADVVAFVGGNTPSVRATMVLRLLEGEIGQGVLLRALAAFTQVYAGKFATTADFERVVSEAAQRDLGWFFRQWVYGVGHPEMSVSWRHDVATRRVTLTIDQSPAGPEVKGADGRGFFAGVMEVDIDGRVERLALAPQAQNSFAFTRDEAPRFVGFDYKGRWIAAIKQQRGPEEIRATARFSADPLARRAALIAWGNAALADGAPRQLGDDLFVLCQTLIEGGAYWREKMIALAQMQRVASANGAARAGLDEARSAILVRVIEGQDRDEAWVRFAALNWLGDSRDPRHADLYLSRLRDPSDRIINAAARALDKSKDARAYQALLELEPHPSWKNQSRISMLDGLAELGDPRGGDICIARPQGCWRSALDIAHAGVGLSPDRCPCIAPTAPRRRWVRFRVGAIGCCHCGPPHH